MKELSLDKLTRISGGTIYEVYSRNESGAGANIVVNGNIDDAIEAKSTANNLDPEGDYTVRFISR